MSPRSELTPLAEFPAVEEDPALFDPSPEWFVPGLGSSLREDTLDDAGLGFRALIERRDALSKAWRAATRGPSRDRRRRAKLRRAGPGSRWSDVA
ncbi:MAG TPA: hypothetical protein PLR99_24890 [Polyangiaceae bacterium]|nr:hypothetical protein [Polyangiaceae bacterium]